MFKAGILLFILIILGLVYLLVFSPVFKIKFLSTTPEVNCGSSDEIKKVSQVLGQNFFSIDDQFIQKKIKDKYFCIGGVNVNKTLTDKVKLDLKPRIAILNLIPNIASQSGESSSSAIQIATDSGFLVDIDGVIFEKANFETNLQPVLFDDSLVIGKRLGENIIQKALQTLNIIKNLDINNIGAKIYSKDQFQIGQKPQILFLLNDNLDRQLASLQLILAQAKIDTKEVDFIDLRFDKPVVRYNSKK